jgi:hypothetical protein
MQQQRRGKKTIDFAGVKEVVYGEFWGEWEVRWLGVC